MRNLATAVLLCGCGGSASSPEPADVAADTPVRQPDTGGVPVDGARDAPIDVAADLRADVPGDVALDAIVPADVPAETPLADLGPTDVGPVDIGSDADGCGAPPFPDGVSCTDPGAGDSCADLTTIPWCDGIVLTGDTCGAADDFTLSCGVAGTADRVYVLDQNLGACGCLTCATYQFAVTPGFIYQIRLYNELYGGCSTFEAGCGTGFGLGGGCGYTHLLVVERADGGCGPYTVTVSFYCKDP